ncbi:MAG TPA: AAA family ATPase, partial [Accumulibacter sp.]|nr:AAA family ATPase [Accumulibacter sp.]
MIPLSLLIQNIGPHGDTRVDFRDLPSPLAVVGEYGSGKTYLIEGIFAAIYGEFAFYPSSIYDALTLDAPEDGLIHLWFEHDGETFQAEQKIKRSRKREATIRDASGNL